MFMSAPPPWQTALFVRRIRNTALLAAGLLCIACRSRPGGATATRHHREVDQTHAVSPSTLFSDTLLTLHEAALVVFWNTSADTLGPTAAADALRELSDRATWASEFLDQYDIPVYATRATALVVRPAEGPGRFVDLGGLDYPFGFVLVEPGYAEEFLTGLQSEDELADALVDYFDLEPPDSLGTLRTRAAAPFPRLTLRARGT
jgi:hypothetical protein